MNIIEFDPSKGGARQGDVYLWPLPKIYQCSKDKIIKPQNSRLVLAEGELTGHHHSFHIMKHLPQPTMFHDEALSRSIVKTVKSGDVVLYDDRILLRKLISDGILTNDGGPELLCIGFAEVKNGSAPLEHQEHDSIMFNEFTYYSTRQREFTAGDVRRVED